MQPDADRPTGRRAQDPSSPPPIPSWVGFVVVAIGLIILGIGGYHASGWLGSAAALGFALPACALTYRLNGKRETPS